MDCRWPGKLTLILPALPECSKWICADDLAVALRHPSDELSNLILSRCGIPLVSSSANMAGSGDYLDIKDIPDCVKDNVDLVVDAGTLPYSSPSTILRLVRGRI